MKQIKFNWGTGIFIFLILFLMAAAVFIGFAMRQDVSLVHEDYYERGVDYNEQMQVKARSRTLQDSLKVDYSQEFMNISLHVPATMAIDSGQLLLFRPSSSRLDISQPWNQSIQPAQIPLQDLFQGRYILKVEWYTDGLRYEIDQALVVP